MIKKFIIPLVEVAVMCAITAAVILYSEGYYYISFLK